ncbi:MAG TPA: hypothetical protein VGL46_09565 [Pseudonocardiaceae bacterium]
MSSTETDSSRAHLAVLAPLRVHPVGTVPAGAGGDPLSTMQWHLDHRHGATMVTLPFETDERWIIGWLDAREQVRGLVKLRAGGSQSYGDLPYFTLAEGYQLTTADLALGRPQLTENAFQVYEDLVGEDIPSQLQVGIPNAIDLAYFVSGSAETSAEWMPEMQAMVAGEVSEIANRWGDRVVFQLESPVILLAYATTPREDWALLTRELASQVAGILGAAPNSDWVLHLCYGDLEHQSLIEPTDLAAAVQFLNTLAEVLAGLDIPMPTVHLPVAYGDKPPSTDPQFYADLRDLRRGIAVIAGVVAESHPDQTRTAIGLVVDALAGPVEGIGAACGHGRRTNEAAAANAELAASVAHSWATSTPGARPGRGSDH